MSLEDRCVQFHEAALGTGKSKGPKKEIETLRKFLHKNQTQRFSDKASSRLFDTISIYASHEDGEGLLEDALKLPFTVFSTKQKSKFMKWMEDKRGASNGIPGQPQSQQIFSLTVIEIEDNNLIMMDNESGDSYEAPLPPGELGRSIQGAFETSSDAVEVKVKTSDGKIQILEMA
jgi:hypothetical protein